MSNLRLIPLDFKKTYRNQKRAIPTQLLQKRSLECEIFQKKKILEKEEQSLAEKRKTVQNTREELKLLHESASECDKKLRNQVSLQPSIKCTWLPIGVAYR